MEMLNTDFGQMDLNKKSKSDRLLDIEGADLDSNYNRQLIYQLVNDTYHISAGGQLLRENQGFVIQIGDQDCIHYLKKNALVCQAQCPRANGSANMGFVENGAMFFEGLQMSIGGVEFTTSQARFYQQQKLSKLGKKKLEYIQKGLCLKTSDFASQTNLDQTVLLANDNPYFNYCRQLQQHFQMQSSIHTINGNTMDTVTFVVPLHTIFPAIDEWEDDGAICTTLGQTLKFSLRTVLAKECVQVEEVKQDPNFVISNIGLLKVYSKLDAPRIQAVQKSIIEYPKLKYEQYPITSVQSSLTPIFPITQKDRVRGLIFAFHSNIPSSKIVLAVGENLYDRVSYSYLCDNVPTFYKYPLGYFPQVLIEEITYSIGGEPVSLSMTQVQPFHMSNYFGDKQESYRYPLQNQTKWAYYIDLTRQGFNEDLFGSSGKQTSQIQFQIRIKVGDQSWSLYNQRVDWNVGLNAQNNGLGNFSFYAYLETQQMFEQRNGIFQMQ